jgi:metallophosphoesterase (TIGR00282 family)
VPWTTPSRGGRLNILFIADVIGAPGREVVKALLPALRQRYDAQLVICNVENSAGGFGLNRESGESLAAAGVDVFTGGNHLWDRKESTGYVAEEPRLVRPANLPPGTPGEGWRVFHAADGTTVGVVSLLGRVFMKEADCPFRAADRVLAELKDRCQVVFVDFHAETTAEKVAMGWHLDGRAAVLVGTHTHVQTADERVLPGGTAFLCDAGMTGGFESVIGMDRHAALARFLTLLPQRLTPATVDPTTGRASAIRRLAVPLPATAQPAHLRLLAGEDPASTVRMAMHAEVQRLRATGVIPALALVSVGEDPASRIYLRRKSEACAEVGIETLDVALPAGSATAAVVERVRRLGEDPAVHGIMVQLPLALDPAAPGAPTPRAIIEAIPPAKDVDGFHPINVGRLAAGLPGFVPCTPLGIHELLRHYEVPLAGRHVVVLGRSNIVGRPLATLLSRKGVDATVTLGHSASGPGLQDLARQADVLVCAIGNPEMVTADWVRPGATVVDVGVHRIPDPTRRTGSRLVGDVEAGSVSKVAGALTPVPGGVGPMTVAMVLANTVLAASGTLSR